MRTPIWHYTVGTIRRVLSSAVSHDRVIGNARCNRKLVDCLHEAIVGLESVDAIRHALERSRLRIGDKQWLDRLVHGSEGPGRPDQTGTNATNPAGSHLTAAMRR